MSDRTDAIEAAYKAGAEAIYIPEDVFVVRDDAPEMTQALILTMREAMERTAVRCIDAALAALLVCQTCGGSGMGIGPPFTISENHTGPCPNPSCIGGKDYGQAAEAATGLEFWTEEVAAHDGGKGQILVARLPEVSE